MKHDWKVATDIEVIGIVGYVEICQRCGEQRIVNALKQGLQMAFGTENVRPEPEKETLCKGAEEIS